MRMSRAWSGRGRHASWTALLAVVAVGCQVEDAASPDQPVASRTEEAEGPSTSRDAPRTPTENMAARKWAEVTISVRSALKPNTPISLAVAYTAVHAASSADLRVVLPEVESARRTAWDDAYGTQSGYRLPAVARTSRAFSAGGRFEQSVALTVEAGGIYRVHVAAPASGIDWSEVRERVQRAAHEVVWLLVDDSGGRVLPAFDPEIVPEGFLKRPGPFRKIRRARADAPQPAISGSGAAPGRASPATAVASPGCLPGYQCMSIQYYDRDTESYESVPYAQYHYQHIDGLTREVVQSGSGYAYGDGGFRLPCPTGPVEAQKTCSTRMTRIGKTGLALGVMLAAACECPPLAEPEELIPIDAGYSRVVIVGTVVDAADEPVAAAEMSGRGLMPDFIEGLRCGRSGAGYVSSTTTDAAGYFLAVWASPLSGGTAEGCLVLSVTPPEGSGLGAVVDTFPATIFDIEDPRFWNDTLKVEVVLPAAEGS